MDTGTLYVVATPIGNLGDMTHRAVEVLQHADLILCEDTRVTGKLKAAYEIDTPLRRYDAHASDKTTEAILDELQAGASIALVSDAGTPGVSDPGVQLIGRAREAGAAVVAVPGASALTAAVSIAAFSGNQFSFLGFVPQKKGRQTFVNEMCGYTHSVLCFESTHRIVKLLTQLAAEAPRRKVGLARELTKLHEEFLTGTPEELLHILEVEPVKQKGEFVVVIYPQEKENE